MVVGKGNFEKKSADDNKSMQNPYNFFLLDKKLMKNKKVVSKGFVLLVKNAIFYISHMKIYR